MKEYDFNLAKKIIDKFTSLTEVEGAYMGMHEDWFWTADSVYENGEYQEPFRKQMIAGIDGSSWATPVIQIELNNGETHVFNCYKTSSGHEEMDILEKIEQMAFCNGGVLSGPVTERRLKEEPKDFSE